MPAGGVSPEHLDEVLSWIRAGAPLPEGTTDPCRGFTADGTCTGPVIEWCDSGAYKRVDCSTKTNGKTACGADPNPALGNNCIFP
jgi:hypothetical protein